jgi:hypothetical protein
LIISTGLADAVQAQTHSKKLLENLISLGYEAVLEIEQ